MKGRKSLVAVAMSAACCALVVATLAELQDSGAATGQRGGFAALRLALYAIGAVGVTFLSLACFRLAGVVTSIATRLDTRPSDVARHPASLRATHLADAVSAWLQEQDAQLRALRDELADLRLRTRLSERQKRQTEAIIYSLCDAVIVTDERDRLLMANEPAATLLGFDAQDARGRSLAEVCGPDHADFIQLLRHSAQSRVEGTRREMVFALKDAPHTFETIVSCVQDGQRVCGVVAVLHDVTREKEISQMKNDFVSHVSHELKTPLASIMAYSEMLADGEAEDEETRREFYTIIQNQAQRLNRLIEDILNISRIESGVIKISKEPVSLAILIEQQMNMIRRYAEEKDITVTGHKPIVFDQVYADKDMISQVIINLLSNAVKYTPAGGTVRIATEVDDTRRVARVTVCDTGVGIPADEIEHVFDKFYRVTGNNKHASGTGLGLNLVKQIVETIHNGRVFVSSEVGVGSTFGFELPLATAPVAPTV